MKFFIMSVFSLWLTFNILTTLVNAQEVCSEEQPCTVYEVVYTQYVYAITPNYAAKQVVKHMRSELMSTAPVTVRVRVEEQSTTIVQ